MNGRSQQVPRGLRHGLLSAVGPALRRLPDLLPLLLALTLAGTALPLPAAALALPWRQSPPSDIEAVSAGRVMAPLQEVSPPEAVQQIQSALAARQPVVDIVSPAPDSLLPPGPWTLRLRVHDWPLVEGGPHLVVQLDQEPPQVWTRSEGLLPELSPGSHRLTVYAALPWGEARKNPGAVKQIRLHRGAANPLALPAPGSPQLLTVSPTGPAAQEPLLLDWLLLDAPLQDVGGSGTQWRLRVTINGDTVLLDQQSPLWLRGWRPGLNALRLELLDGRGEPLNPPFNSLVQEVNLDGTSAAPRWQGGPLSAAELAELLGEAAPSSPAQAIPEIEVSAPARERQAASRSGEAISGAPAAAAEGAAARSLPAPLASAAAPPVRTPAPTAASDVTARQSEASPQPPMSPLAESTLQPPSPQQPGPQPAAGSSLQSRATAAPGSPAAGSAAESLEPGNAAAPGQPQPAAADPDRSPTSAPQTDDRPVADPSGQQGLPQTAVPTPPSAAAATSLPASGQDAERATPSGSGPPHPAAAAAQRPTVPAAVPASAPEPAAVPATALPSPAPPSSPDAIEPSMTAAAPATSAPPQADGTPDERSAPPPEPAPNGSDGDQPQRVRPSSELGGRARDLVNDDGTLRRPERRGPLAGLRERLQR